LSEIKDPELKLEETPIYIINNIESPSSNDSLRTIVLYGDITEDRSHEVVHGLLALNHSRKSEIIDEEGSSETIIKPIKLVVSTYGGSAQDMFAIYDLMSLVKQDCEIETAALGKVMSAGVLLLANGTKGSRRIGKNCRVMIHNVMSMHNGSLPSLENEIKETRVVQERYFEELISCTKLTKSKLKKLLNGNVDAYLSAEEAIKYGIADELI